MLIRTQVIILLQIFDDFMHDAEVILISNQGAGNTWPDNLTILLISWWLSVFGVNIGRRNIDQDTSNNSPSNIWWISAWCQSNSRKWPKCRRHLTKEISRSEWVKSRCRHSEDSLRELGAAPSKNDLLWLIAGDKWRMSFLTQSCLIRLVLWYIF